jgi:hypothetical protein
VLSNTQLAFFLADQALFKLIDNGINYSRQKMGRERDFYEGRQHTKQTKHQPTRVVDLMILNTWMIELVSSARK